MAAGRGGYLGIYVSLSAGIVMTVSVENFREVSWEKEEDELEDLLISII